MQTSSNQTARWSTKKRARKVKLTEGGRCSVLCHQQKNLRRLLSGCRHADAESAVSSGPMHVLRHAGVGSKKVARRTTQSFVLTAWTLKTIWNLSGAIVAAPLSDPLMNCAEVNHSCKAHIAS